MRERDGDRHGGDEKGDDDADAGYRGEVARGKGTTTLAWMLPVGLDVQQIVDDVSCGCAEAEGEKRQQGGEHECGLQGVAEQHGQKEQNIFRPLMDPDGL